MATKLIQLADGTLVEAEVPEGQAQPISKKLADKVNATFERIQPILVRVCEPVAEACKELDGKLDIEQAEVEIGFSFEGEGTIYVTRAKATSTLSVKLAFKPKS